MSEIIKGRNVRVELAATFGGPKTITGISKASPGVATCVGHAIPAGTVGYLRSLDGMVQLENQAVRVASVTADTFALQGINTTNFSDFSGTCEFVPAATWVTLAEATSYAIGGGAAEKLDTTTLIDVIKQEENGLLAAQTLALNVLAKTTPSAAMLQAEAAAQSGGKLLVRITLNDGALRIAYGEPDLPGEDVQKGAIGTGAMTISAKGFIPKLPASFA